MHQSLTMQSLYEMRAFRRSGMLCFADSVIAFLVIAPLVISFWRGCWQLMDIYLFAMHMPLSICSSGIIGVSGCVIIDYFQTTIKNALSPAKRPWPFYVGSRFYTIFAAFCITNYWRAVWLAWDLLTTTSWQSAVTSIAFGVLSLAGTRSIRNVLCPPLITTTDHNEKYFKIDNIFDTKKGSEKFFLGNVLFTVVVTGSLTCSVFRGGWVLMDVILAPNDLQISTFASMVIGISVLSVAFTSQFCIRLTLREVENAGIRMFVEDVYFLWSHFGVINLWRGVWYLENLYLVPENYPLSNCISVVVSSTVLIAMQCSNSIPIRGGVMDGTAGEESGKYPTEYLRFYFQQMKVADCRQPEIDAGQQSTSTEPNKPFALHAVQADTSF